MVEDAKSKGVSQAWFFHAVQHLQALQGRLGGFVGLFVCLFVFCWASSFLIFSGEKVLITFLSKN